MEKISTYPQTPSEFVQKWQELLFPYMNDDDRAEFREDLARSFPEHIKTILQDQDYVECPGCKKPEGSVNHVHGHVFVGWGCGWQPCARCGGSSRIPRFNI
jgi:hypothetical protein